MNPDEIAVITAAIPAAWPQFGGLPAAEQSALIAAGWQSVLDFCRRPGFLQTSITETKNGRSLPRLWLNQRPVISVETITVNGEALDNTSGESWSFTPGTGELVRYDGQYDLRFPFPFPAGRQNITVQYWAGYTCIPDPVIRAAIMMVKYLYTVTQRTLLFSAESIGDYSYSLGAYNFLEMTMPKTVAALLAPYVQDDGPL